ncbi:MAG: hypothetical protein ACRD6W_00960, partial [Nitrososphaerales archaeon]
MAALRPSQVAPRTEFGYHDPVRRGIFLAAIVGIMLLMLLSAGLNASVSIGPAHAIVSAPRGVVATGDPLPTAAKVRSPLPSIPQVTAPNYIQNVTSNSENFDDGFNTAACPVIYQLYGPNGDCDSWATQPSLFNYGNGSLGLLYQVGTATTNPVCGNLSVNNGSSRLAYTSSTDGGATWGAGTLIGQT